MQAQGAFTAPNAKFCAFTGSRRAVDMHGGIAAHRWNRMSEPRRLVKKLIHRNAFLNTLLLRLPKCSLIIHCSLFTPPLGTGTS